MVNANLSGQVLQSALSETPYLSLNFYSFGVTLRKQEGDVISEYPISPAQAAVALAARVTFNTGLLTGDTIYIRMNGASKIIVEYRKPQRTALFLDSSDAPLHIPLPGLVMLRKTAHDLAPSYMVFAVKQRPTTFDTELFHTPLPNVFTSAAVCWGTVQRVSDDALSGVSLAEDWGQLLGSPFGDHACSGKSRSHRGDIRQKFVELEARSARRYPVSDLISARKTLAQTLGE